MRQGNVEQVHGGARCRGPEGEGVRFRAGLWHACMPARGGGVQKTLTCHSLHQGGPVRQARRGSQLSGVDVVPRAHLHVVGRHKLAGALAVSHHPRHRHLVGVEKGELVGGEQRPACRRPRPCCTPRGPCACAHTLAVGLPPLPLFKKNTYKAGPNGAPSRAPCRWARAVCGPGDRPSTPGVPSHG